MNWLIYRTSPSYANYSSKSEELNQIENSICKELDAFNNQFFTLYGYNQQTHSIDQIHSILHSELIQSSQYSFYILFIINRDGFTSLFQQALQQTSSSDPVTIHYHRISSSHFSIPSYEAIDQYSPTITP